MIPLGMLVSILVSDVAGLASSLCAAHCIVTGLLSAGPLVGQQCCWFHPVNALQADAAYSTVQASVMA